MLPEWDGIEVSISPAAHPDCDAIGCHGFQRAQMWAQQGTPVPAADQIDLYHVDAAGEQFISLLKVLFQSIAHLVGWADELDHRYEPPVVRTNNANKPFG